MKGNIWIVMSSVVLLAAAGCTGNAQNTGLGQQVGLARFDVPAPILVEGREQVIGLDNFGDQLSVHVNYASMAVGHTVGLRWRGKELRDMPLQTVGQVGALVFKVPRSVAQNDVGSTARLTASVGVPGSPLIISSPLDVQVVQSLPFEIPAPKLVGINAEGDYRPGNDDAMVNVDYPTMKVGDTVGLRWKGRETTTLPVQRIGKLGPVTFKVPVSAVSRDVGSAVMISASVGGDGNPLRISQAVSARILAQSPLEAPIAEQAVQGELDLNRIAASTPIKVQAQRLQKDDIVGMRWQGVERLDLPTQRYGGTGDILFQVNKDAVVKDLDKTVRITASLGRGGNPLVISAPLDLKIVKSALPPGEIVAARLNERYRAVPAACNGNTPAYYCSGVITRGTTNDAFDPWNPSPGSVNLGSVSFSFIRMDSHTPGLYGRSGFIFTDQETAIAQGKAQTLRCIYPYNASTSTNANNNGCGLRRTLDAVDQSSCAAINVTTAAQWVNHARGVPSSAYQCSLSTQVPSQFLASLQARATPLPNMTYGWNEILIQTWPQNIGDRLPIEAFYYIASKAGGAADAKVYQTKYKTRTNLWVPVIRLDESQYGKGDPFTYLSTDQAVQP